ncbi:MAG: glyoxalase [Spirochaetales bacterium]|nr:glyoxalase [Spirochaetales bacterium]
MIHHIAIGTRQVQTLFEFYKKLPGLTFLAWQYTADGRRRAAWFDAQGTILMLEESDISEAPRALVFSWREEWHQALLERACDTSVSTIYLQDPDGNRLGYSRYPDALPG